MTNNGNATSPLFFVTALLVYTYIRNTANMDAILVLFIDVNDT